MRRLSFVACSVLLAACSATSKPVEEPAASAVQPRTVRCRWIEIVDASDRVVIRLGTSSDGHPRISILDEQGWSAIELGLMDVVDDEGRKTGTGAMVHLETGDGIVGLGTSAGGAGLVVTRDDKVSFSVNAGETLTIEKTGEKP